ncbi:Lysozyme inhibitor LprI [compost metagenome]
MRTMVLITLAMLAFGAQAQEEESTPCDNVETEQQNYDCALYNKNTAERELNSAYADLLDRVKDQYAGKTAQVNEATARIKAAEQLWSKLRDADCAVETFQNDKGSKDFDIALNTCLAQRSDDRSEYLQSLVSE